MKHIIHISRVFTLLAILITIVSCSENGYEDPIDEALLPEDLPWQANTHIYLELQEDALPFRFAIDPDSGDKVWDNTQTQLIGFVESILPVTQIEKVDIYATAVEEEGLNYNEYNKRGKLVKSVSEIDEDGEFVVDLTVEELYALFTDDFTFERNGFPALPGDHFDLRWVIQHKNGEVYDSRELNGINTQFGLPVKSYLLTPAVWDGDYTWEITASSADAQAFGLLPGFSGSTTISETERGSQVYTIPDPSFAAGDSNGVISYDYETGLTSVTSTYQTSWKILSVNGAQMEIEVHIGYFDQIGYDLTWTVLLNRADGEDWPEEPHTPKSE